MKTLLYPLVRFPLVAAMALLGALTFPTTSEAKHKHKSKDKSHGRQDRASTHYHSHPRSGFTISFGTGYAGRGYYYGPPGAAYYYERPDVRYYRNRHDVPGYNSGRRYYGGDEGPSYRDEGSRYRDEGPRYRDDGGAAVQRALYRLGYYRGPIDGDIGPGSRRAIARFEADNGLPVSGYVSRPLLEALGLR